MNTRIKKIVKISRAQAGRIEETSTLNEIRHQKKEKKFLNAQKALDTGG